MTELAPLSELVPPPNKRHYNYLTLSYHFIIHEEVIKQHNCLQSKLFGPLSISICTHKVFKRVNSLFKKNSCLFGMVRQNNILRWNEAIF